MFLFYYLLSLFIKVWQIVYLSIGLSLANIPANVAFAAADEPRKAELNAAK